MAFFVITLVLIINFTRLTIQTCHHEVYEEPNCRTDNDYTYSRQICDEFYVMDCYMVDSNLDSTHKLAVRKIEICLSNIGSLNSKLFAGFENVKIISMIGVNITKVEPYSFQNLGQLTVLDLNNNCIEVLSTGSFSSFSLDTINLSNNNISSIERDLFSYLNTLLLIGNKIVDVSNLTANCYNLTQLNLSYNFIRKLELGDGCLNLLDLELSFNEITAFSVSTKTPLKLRSLYLSSNKLHNISATNFQNLNNLLILDLSNNPLFQENNPATDLFQNTINVQYLNLSCTGIQKITVGTFTKLFKLAELDLSRNNLSFISKGTFLDTSCLKKLYINDNRLVRFRYEGLESLKQIDLNGNIWTCDTLADLTSKLRNNSVHIAFGDTRNVENILGISCVETNEEKHVHTLTNITKYEEEYYSLLNNLNLSIKQLMLQQENRSNMLNQDYKNLFQIVETNVQDVTQKIINVLNLTQNANRSQFNDTNIQPIATNFTKLLGKTFLGEIKNIYNTTLSKIQNKFEETVNTDRKNIIEEMRNIFDSSLTKIQVNFQQIVRVDRKSFIEEIRNIFSPILSTIQQPTNNGLFPRQIPNESDIVLPKSLNLKSANENVNVPRQNYQSLVIGVYGILAVLVIGLIFHLVTKARSQRMIQPEPRENNLFSSMPI